MKKYINISVLFLFVVVNFGLSAVELKNSSDVIAQMKFVDVFLWSADNCLKQEECVEAKNLKKLMIELQPYVQRLQKYGYILNSSTLKRTLEIYKKAKQLFDESKAMLKQSTIDECERIFRKLEPIMPLMQGILDVRITYPFIKQRCQLSKDTEEKILCNFCSEYFKSESITGNGGSLADGNILVYLSEYRGVKIIVELTSSSYASFQAIKKRSEIKSSILKRLILRPCDVLLLVKGLEYTSEEENDIIVLHWSENWENVIKQLEENKDLTKDKIKLLLEYVKSYLEMINKQIQLETFSSEKDSGKSDAIAIDTEIGNLAIKMLEDLINELEKTESERYIATLRNFLQSTLFASSDTTSIAQEICVFLKKTEEEQQIKTNLKWINRLMHTEPQCIVLRIAELNDHTKHKFSPTQYPLISLKNPCISCLTLPYIRKYSPNNGFFYFMYRDKNYAKATSGTLDQELKSVKIKNPQIEKIKAQINYSYFNDAFLRPWYGKEKSAMIDLTTYFERGKAQSTSGKKIETLSQNLLKKAKDYGALITIKDTTIQLVRVSVPGDGDCGYHALNQTYTEGTNSREKLLTLLRETITSETEQTAVQAEIRRLIRQEIIDRLVAGDFDGLPQDHSLHPLVVRFPPSVARGDDIQTIENFINDKVIIAYLNYLNDERIPDTWLQIHPGNGRTRGGVADAIALLQGANLMVIEGRLDHNVGEVLHFYNIPDAPADTPTIYLIQSTNNHYDRGESKQSHSY